MSVRNTLHLLLGIPTLVAVGVVLTFFVRAGDSDISEKSTNQLASQA